MQQLFEAQFQAKAIRAEDRLKVVPDERTNSLVVSTSTRSFAVFEQLLKQLDQKVAPEIKEIRTVALNSASAVRLAPIIQQVMDARLDRLRKIQPETAELERAVVVADSRSNSLIVAAANESWQVAEKLIADLDRENESEQAGMNVLSLKKGNLDRVANAINQIMDRRYADLPAEVRRRVRPMVLTDPRTSSLIIAAAPGDFADIERVVTQLEATPLDPAVAVEVMPLATAPGGAVGAHSRRSCGSGCRRSARPRRLRTGSPWPRIPAATASSSPPTRRTWPSSADWWTPSPRPGRRPWKAARWRWCFSPRAVPRTWCRS